MDFFARLFGRRPQRRTVRPSKPFVPAPDWPPPPVTGIDNAIAPKSPDTLGPNAPPIWVKYPTGQPLGHIIVFANEKGGVGKSTSAFHTCIALCNAGESVAALDVDLRQLTLNRALWSREDSARRFGVTLPGPVQIALVQQNEEELEEKLRMARIRHNFIVIDVGGHDSPIARRAIALADTIVTPVNDSFIDLDMLGHIDPHTGAFKTLGNFARLVAHLREASMSARPKALDWVVMQNRARNFATRNEKQVLGALQAISPVAGFRVIPGLRERVTYRELFPIGLTLFDLEAIPSQGKLQPRAREEIWAMLRALKLPSAALNVAISAPEPTE